MILLLLTYIVTSIEITQLPASNSSPPRMIHSTSSAEDSSSIIYFFGGEQENGLLSSSIFSFDLKFSFWSEVIPLATFSPPGLSRCKSFITSKKLLYIFFGMTKKGISENLYFFNLNYYYWSLSSFQGDFIVPSVDSADCLFTFGNVKYLALYGGVSILGISQHFYLIDIETLKVQGFYKNSPGYMTEGSLVFYNNSLYLFGAVEGRLICQLFRFDLNEKVWEEVLLSKEVSARKGQKAAVYKDKIFVFFGYQGIKKYSEVLRIDLLNFSCNFLTYAEYLYGSSIQLMQDSLVFGLGRTFQSYENSIKLFNLQTNIYSNLSKSADFPISRKNHISWPFNNSIYIFGGLSSTGETLNDMWRFEASTNKWVAVEVSGSLPAPRENMGSYFISGSGLLISSGKSGSSLFNDLYYYEPKSSTWANYGNSQSSFSSRYNPCIFLYSYKAIIFGGQDFQGFLNDLWIYDFYEDRLFKIQVKGENVLKIVNYRCVFETYELGVKIYLVGGTFMNNEPNDVVFLVTITNFFNSVSASVSASVSVSEYWTEENLSISDFSLEIHDSMTYISSGRRDQELNKKIMSINLKNREIIEEISIPQNLWLTGHTMTHLGDYLYLFGGSYSKSGFLTSIFYSNNLFKISFKGQKFQLSCRYGEIVKNKCVPCKAGFYSVDNRCEPCPAGTFYEHEGACTMQMCTPCGYGYFNDETGKIYCKQCSTGTFCPVGTSYPLPRLVKLTATSKQPEDYQSRSEEISAFYQVFLWSFMGVALFLLSAILVSEWLRERLMIIDFFASRHSQELNIPVVYKKTYIGGYFTLMFFIFAAFTTAYSLMSFQGNNLIESKTLSPLATNKISIKSNSLQFSLNFYGFAGICSEEFYFQKEKNILYTEKFISLNSTGSTCEFHLKLNDFQLLADGNFEFGINNVMAYCSYMSLKVISSSSIPGETSEVFIPLYPTNETQLFRGFDASIFELLFIPSVIKNQLFYSDSQFVESPQSGYHVVDKKSHKIGSVVDQNSMSTLIFLVVRVQMELSENVFNTKRILKYTTFLFVGSLFGSLVGFMGTFGSFMTWTEALAKVINKRRNRKILTLESFRMRKYFFISSCDDQIKLKGGYPNNTSET